MDEKGRKPIAAIWLTGPDGKPLRGQRRAPQGVLIVYARADCPEEIARARRIARHYTDETARSVLRMRARALGLDAEQGSLWLLPRP